MRMLILASLATFALNVGLRTAPVRCAEAGHAVKLQSGDVVALCGDSITSAGSYPNFLEAYQLCCCPEPKVSWKNFGRWGETAAQFPPAMDKDVLPAKPTVATICYGMNNCRSGKVMSPEQAAGWGTGEIRAVVKKFKDAGVRLIVLGSPGCVDSEHFTLSQSAPSDPKAVEATNKNLTALRDSAEKIAKEDGLVFADVNKPMLEVMAKAKEKYGRDFAFAGGKGDGVHPGQAGHLVMAWVFLKALGYSGEIGTITVDWAKNSATATDGHTVLSCKNGVVSLESSRYPFCFLGDPNKAGNFKSANCTRSVVELFPFNADLNRLTLIVANPAPKMKVTWGGASKEYTADALTKGINLADEFLDNPFCGPFGKVIAALAERNNCYRWLAHEYKGDANMQKRLDTAIAATIPAPVKHEISIEAVK